MIQSWQIFHAAQKMLPKGQLQGIFTRTSRLVSFWAADPRYCAETRRNPVDRIRILLEALDLAGGGQFARAAIDYMAEPLGGQFAYRNDARSDKGSVDGEIADLAVAIGDLAGQVREALEDGEIDSEERIRIGDAALGAKREVEQLLDAAGMG